MGKKLGIGIAGFIILFLLLCIPMYNSIVKSEEKMKQDWSEVQNTYQRRLDLVPNLVNVVKGVSEFEQGILLKIAESRSRAARMNNVQEITSENYRQQKQVQDSLATDVNRLILLIENYPDLKGTKAYSALQVQLEGTERRIRVARQDFNESVFNYNRRIKQFPANLVASVLGFKPRAGFASESGAEKAVEIKFN